MAFGDKPSSYPEWADGGGATITEPLLAKKQLGWVAAEAPLEGNLNWWMNLVYNWTGYLGAFESADHTWTGHHTFNGTVDFGTVNVNLTGSALNFLANSRMSLGSGAFANAPFIRVKDAVQWVIGNGSTDPVVLDGSSVRAPPRLIIGGSPPIAGSSPGRLEVNSQGTVDLLSGSTFKVESGAIFELLNSNFDAQLGVIIIGGPASGNGFIASDNTVAHWAAFDASHRWMANEGFYTPGDVIADGHVEAGPGSGFVYTSSLERYFIVPANLLVGRLAFTPNDTDANGEPTLLLDATYIGGTTTLHARCLAPEGAQIDKIDILIQNTNASAKVLSYRHLQATVNDETSDMTASWFNPAGGSHNYDTVTIAGSAPLAWVELPKTGGVATQQSNGYIETSIFPNATGASTGLVIKAIRFRYAQPRVGSIF